MPAELPTHFRPIRVGISGVKERGWACRLMMGSVEQMKRIAYGQKGRIRREQRDSEMG